MTVPNRNYNIAELRRLDLAHHLPSQQDHKLMQELGGSRIMTRAALDASEAALRAAPMKVAPMLEAAETAP
jgi:hypothetical protein